MSENKALFGYVLTVARLSGIKPEKLAKEISNIGANSKYMVKLMKVGMESMEKLLKQEENGS